MTGIAIETRYAGCRFRSRLEARWAVFFDHVGVAWEYEPQGFVIDGRAYLPDFRLTDCGTWVEVKGEEARLDKPLMLAAAKELPHVPGRGEDGPRLLILGPLPQPPPHVYVNHLGSAAFDWGWMGLDLEDGFEGGEPYVQGRWWGFGSYRKNRRPWLLCNTSTATPDEFDDALWLEPAVDPYEVGVMDAYTAARSARFEHGESG